MTFAERLRGIEKRMMSKSRSRAEVSLVLDRTCEGTLSEQLAERLRRCIANGVWKPGSVLPGIRELAKLCGTSTRVPKAAIAMLEGENLVRPRPRLGCEVLAGDRNVWRGRVLFVKSGQFDSYYQNTAFGVLAERLTEARYHVELVSVRQGANGAFNLVDLKRSLADSADLVFVTGRAPCVAAAVAASGRPFFQLFGSVVSEGGRCVGQCRFSAENAFGRLFAQYKAKGVRSVRLIAMEDDHLDFVGVMRAAGIRVDADIVSYRCGDRRLEQVMRAGIDAAKRLMKPELPDLLVVSDDYLAIGVLQELAERGISALRDLGLVVCSNRGFAPVSARSLTRFEWNAFADGERLAHRVIQYLSRGIPPGRVSLPVRYLSGRTF